ncbi:MAG: LytR/AlgR family response regulator transcription factor [Kordiimonas sp.]
MRVLIIEDEPRAANRLVRMIKAQLPAVQVLDKIGSVKGALQWFLKNEEPDLIFLDVRLEDGDSFEILKKRDIKSPIIFCTAYSEYALSAFEANSIDYLLKPVSEEKLARALAKYERFLGFKMETGSWQSFSIEEQTNRYKKRFMVTQGRKLVMLDVDHVIILETYLKGTKLIGENGREWVLDDPVSAIEKQLDPEKFYRISRQDIVRLSAIQSIQKTESGHIVHVCEGMNCRSVSRARVKGLRAALQKL